MSASMLEVKEPAILVEFENVPIERLGEKIEKIGKIMKIKSKTSNNHGTFCL